MINRRNQNELIKDIMTEKKISKRPGPTGDFPDGQIFKDDEGALNIGIASDKEKGIVIMDFGSPVKWIGLSPEDIYGLTKVMIEKANEIDISIKETKRMEEGPNLELYADGACSCNPGKGAYASILRSGGKDIEYIKAFKHTTNNRMELLGVIEPLESFVSFQKIHIFSDSQYIVKAVNEGWLKNWIRKNWKKSNNKPVLNIDLWKRLIPLLEKHNLTFTWIKGHSGNHYNNKCDELAINAYNGSDFVEDKGYVK